MIESTRDLPRPEYPRPQFVRVDPATGQPDWLCLNGEWEFEIDNGDSGKERGLLTRPLEARITVPFCPESSLSGIENTDFMRAVWYRRTVTLPEAWKGKAILLHFQAVDYDTTVWVIRDGSATPSEGNTSGGSTKPVEIGRHRGGFTPFSCSLDGIAEGGETVTIYVRARDYDRGSQPRGKQSTRYAPHSCFYTRTTGIWQTVWMEALPREAAFRGRPRITPDVGGSAFHLQVPLTQNRPGYLVRARLTDADGTVVVAETRADLDFAPRLDLALPEGRRRLWSLTDPYLYGLRFELMNEKGAVLDALDSYAGLRSIAIEGKKVKINGETIFQRTILDQGYWPDGVMTAPTDEAFVRDIQIAQEAGFNGARLHQKVFEERFLYHADRLGYLVWGEFADWGASGNGPSHDHQQPGMTYVAQWLEALQRDYSHPAIIGWCALNETWQLWQDRITTLDDATLALFLAAKAMDTTRPVLDASGYAHRVRDTDVYDSHDYIEEKDFAEGLAKFRRRHRPEAVIELSPHINNGSQPPVNPQTEGPTWSVPYLGQPYWVSEFGGFRYTGEKARSAEENKSSRQTSWGYGQDPRDPEEFYERFEGTCRILMDNPFIFGFCYTQLTDIFPEENGLVRFDRSPKFDMARLRSILERVAAIEEA